MTGRRRRNRIAVLLGTVVSAAAIATVFAALVVGEARVKSIPGLAVAVFGTFLTSMAIIAAFSIEERSRWPTPWEALDRAHVPIWFVVGLASVVTALLAGANDSSFLSALSLTMALVAVPLGTWGLWGLIALSSDQGRWRLVVDLLADSILKAGRAAGDPGHRPDLGEIETEGHVPSSFLTAGETTRPQRTGVAIELVPGVLREYADRRDLEAIVRLVDEVHAGACQALDEGSSVDFEVYCNSVDRLLLVQRQMFAELTGRVRSGQLGDATARIAVARAGEAIVDTAGRARRLDGSGAAERLRLERLVARHLTALCRLAGATAQAVGAELRDPGQEGAGSARTAAARARALALRSVCVELQKAVRWAVDNDPPGMKIPPGHVWRAGLTDPESALAWLWSAAESESGPFGVGLYASCEILTGRKFFESYWDGFDVFTAIERRLYGGDQGTLPAGSREAVERAGGLPRLALELGAARLAATPARAAGPSFDGDPARRDDRHAACNLFLAGAGYKPRGRDPVADLAWLLTDRRRGSLWTTVYEQLSSLPDATLPPPLRPLHRHPDACALAVCLRLTPLGEAVSTAALGEVSAFVAALPEPLLDGAATLALALTSTSPAALPRDRAGREEALIEAARFARGIVPAPLPEQAAAAPPEAGAAPQSRAVSAQATPPDPVAPGFEGALERIASAESELEVDLVQLDHGWLDERAEERAELDATLLAAVLRGRARVRRIVLFDLPPDASRQATRARYRWGESLSAAVGCFAWPGEGRSRYAVRLLVLPRAGGPVALPADRIAIRARGGAGASADREFEELWTRFDRQPGAAEGGLGLIELGAGSAGRFRES